MLTRTHVLFFAAALTVLAAGCAHQSPMKENTTANTTAAIRSLEVPALTIAPGETVPLRVYARGSGPLQYTWTVSAGKLMGADKAVATLVAPATEGVVRVEVVVTDSKQSTARLDVDLTVDPGAAVAISEELDPFQPKATPRRALAKK